MGTGEYNAEEYPDRLESRRGGGVEIEWTLSKRDTLGTNLDGPS